MIFVARNGQQQGPYSEDDVRAKLLASQLAVTDLAWREGMSDWRPLSELLRIELPPPPPVPHPPVVSTTETVTISATAGRPVVGIVVASLIGAFEFIWSGTASFRSFYFEPSGETATFNALFPGTATIRMAGENIAVAGALALLIGTTLSFVQHRHGNKTVRVTCYCMIGCMFLSVTSLFLAMGLSPSWGSLDAPTKGAVIGGLIGAGIGGMFEWGLILFFFRKRRWKI